MCLDKNKYDEPKKNLPDRNRGIHVTPHSVSQSKVHKIHQRIEDRKEDSPSLRAYNAVMRFKRIQQLSISR